MRNEANTEQTHGSVSRAVSILNGEFGALLDSVRRSDLKDPEFQQYAYRLWVEHRGLLVVRGEDLQALAPEDFLAWAKVFGRIDEQGTVARDWAMVENTPILKIGNIKDEDGNRRAVFALSPALQSDEDVRYNPQTRRPVWHTDSTFKPIPPIGSVFHCKRAPSSGGDTLFADMRGAFAALDEPQQQRLQGLEAVCSLAHHDKKISLYSPGYPTLSPEQRAANPANRVPVILTHPISGEPAIYGLNSSTCAIVPIGEEIDGEAMDRYDLEGEEDASVMILRDLLPRITGPQFTVRWHWQPGDVVVWDNRCTLHAASGFDHETELREMWRLTLLEAEN